MKNVLSFILLLLALKSYSTAQTPDRIYYNGQVYSLLSNPMETFFKQYPDKRPSGPTSTALWRGYIATFEFVENELFLKDIETEVQDTLSTEEYGTKWISFLHDIVEPGTRLKIDWMTDLLILPYGKIVNYVHMGYASTFENYILIEVNQGDFVKAKKMTYEEYEPFKERQFQAFKKTDEYKQLVEELSKQNRSAERIEEFLRIYVIEYSTKILTE